MWKSTLRDGPLRKGGGGGGGVRRVKKQNTITGKQDDQGKKVHLRILTSPKIPIPSQSVSQSRHSLISHDFLNEIQ